MLSWRYDPEDELRSLYEELHRYREVPPLTSACVPVRALQIAAIERHIARLEDMDAVLSRETDSLIEDTV